MTEGALVVCQVCGAALDDGRPLVRCRQCSTVHHADCWDYMGRCSTFGCPGTRTRPVDGDGVVECSTVVSLVAAAEPAPPAPRPAPPRPPSRKGKRGRKPRPPLRLNGRPGDERRFPILSPFGRLWGILLFVVMVGLATGPAPALRGGAGLVVLLACLVTLPQLRGKALHVDRRNRTLTLGGGIMGLQRTALGGLGDVRSVSLRIGGLLGRCRVCLVMRDGGELEVGSFSSRAQARGFADDLARTVGAKLLVERT